ncbi:MAG TPA: hypothetical protein VFA22_08285 [Stellaceae bacterium]|nr:hypothetical protein [Stellaceae bacterium]
MKMKPTGTQTGLSHGTPGHVYLLDDDGLIDVPDELAEIARSHGFRPVPAAAPPRAPRRARAER